MIAVTNDQHEIPVTIGRLKDTAAYLLGLVNYPDFDLGLFLTTPAKMNEFNKKFRGKDTPTDILSFLYYQDIQPGEHITPTSEEEKYLGDIILCPEYIQQHLDEWPEQTVNDRIERLLVHGVCHLLGYTHDTQENAAVMEGQEHYLLSTIKEKNTK